jgi:hypothetical protein
MTYKLAYNPTDGPVVIDTAGRMIGGREWGAADTTDEFAKTATEQGRLVLPDPPGKGSSADALHEHRRAQALSERQESFIAADKPKLQQLAADAGLIGPDADPSKAELVSLLVHSGVDTPTAATKSAPKE